MLTWRCYRCPWLLLCSLLWASAPQLELAEKEREWFCAWTRLWVPETDQFVPCMSSSSLIALAGALQLPRQNQLSMRDWLRHSSHHVGHLSFLRHFFISAPWRNLIGSHLYCCCDRTVVPDCVRCAPIWSTRDVTFTEWRHGLPNRPWEGTKCEG